MEISLPGMSNNNAEELASYWKKQSHNLQQLLEKEQREFDEYQTDSRDLEESLSREIDQLKAEKAKLSHAVDVLRTQQNEQSERHDRERRELLSGEQRLTKLLEEKTTECKELKEFIRKLELQNDNLERSQRTGMQELTDLTDRLNLALERVVLAESELTETTQQNEEVHRLKEENNYLREELVEVKKPSASNSVDGDSGDGTCLCEIRNTITHTLSKNDAHDKPPLSPLKRNVLPIIKDPIGVIIKMNQIVRDLLLKVDVSQCEMENKISRINATNSPNTSEN